MQTSASIEQRANTSKSAAGIALSSSFELGTFLVAAADTAFLGRLRDRRSALVSSTSNGGFRGLSRKSYNILFGDEFLK